MPGLLKAAGIFQDKSGELLITVIYIDGSGTYLQCTALILGKMSKNKPYSVQIK
jgi:hypothetical protein